MRPPYDVGKAFMAAWRSEIARARLVAGGLVRATTCGDMLVVQVVYLPDGSFDPGFLADDNRRELFTPQGADYWRDLNRLADHVAQGADQRRELVALMLMPSALESARERLAVAA